MREKHEVFGFPPYRLKKNENKKIKLTVSPSLVQGRPFCRYFPWLWRFFWPPSANLHSKGSDGAEPEVFQTEDNTQFSKIQNCFNKTAVLMLKNAE